MVEAALDEAFFEAVGCVGDGFGADGAVDPFDVYIHGEGGYYVCAKGACGACDELHIVCQSLVSLFLVGNGRERT